MRTTYDAAVRDAVRKRMSPPNRESITEIARATGIAVRMRSGGGTSAA